MSGKLIVFSGPSGVGKDTIRKNMKFNDFVFSVSLTTRDKREGEVEGVSYHYVSKEYFSKRIVEGKMLEYAEFVGNYYGTDEDFVKKQLEQGNNVFLEIECQGALQVLGKIEDVISIFIMPPSIEELRNRLVSRGTEDMETIDKRIAKASEELNVANHYKYQVVNNDILEAAAKIDDILNYEIGNK